MKFSFRIIDNVQLPAFRSYLPAQAAAAIESGGKNIFAVGVTQLRNSVGAAAVEISGGKTASLEGFYIDEAARRNGAGSYLLDTTLEILKNMGIKELKTDFVMPVGFAEVFCYMLSKRGFEDPTERSEIYKIPAKLLFSELGRIENKYTQAHRSEVEVKRFTELSVVQKLALETDEAIPEVLSLRLLKDRTDEELSVAALTDRNPCMYILAEQAGCDIPILSAYAKENSAPFQFYCMFAEFLEGCRKRIGGDDFNVCWSVTSEAVERLTKRFPEDELIHYREYVSSKQIN